GLRVLEIKAKNNSRQIVFPRQIAMYLAKHLTDHSLPEIGRHFGGKHHTTVLHSVDKIDEQRKSDKDLNRLINKFTETLTGYAAADHYICDKQPKGSFLYFVRGFQRGALSIHRGLWLMAL